MATGKPKAVPDVPPILPPQRAIELLKRQLGRLESDISKRHHDDPEIAAWENTTANVLEQAFGRPAGAEHGNRHAFRMSSYFPRYIGMPDAEYQRLWVKCQTERAVLLRSFIEQLQDLAPPALAAAEPGYALHPEVERVGGDLYRNRHFKQAAQEAFVHVINAVKERTGLDLEGDALMNRAFGCQSQQPVLRFNALQSEAERDEQKGIMLLFKGVVGIRNFKAHTNVLFDDPQRGFEYLALASLLLRLLEIGQKGGG